MKLDNQQIQTTGATSSQSEIQLIIPLVIKISYLYQKMTLGYLGRHFLRKNHALKETIITLLHKQQANMQNKNPNSSINNTYLQINWSYYSSLDKIIRAIPWIKKLKSNWIKWEKGSKEGRTSA